MSEPLTDAELTEASLEVLASMRRVIEQVRELAFPDQVGQPIEQDAMRALLRLAEEQAAARALATLDAQPDSLDAAWAEAEAALPEGCVLRTEYDPTISDLPAEAEAIDYAAGVRAHVDAESLAAALRALTAKLQAQDAPTTDDT